MKAEWNTPYEYFINDQQVGFVWEEENHWYYRLVHSNFTRPTEPSGPYPTMINCKHHLVKNICSLLRISIAN